MTNHHACTYYTRESLPDRASQIEPPRESLPERASQIEEKASKRSLTCCDLRVFVSMFRTLISVQFLSIIMVDHAGRFHIHHCAGLVPIITLVPCSILSNITAVFMVS